jgi:hypothetical protein
VVLLVLDGHIGGFDRPFSAAVRGAPPAFATLSSLPCRPVEMGCSGGPPGTQRCAWQGLCGRSVAVRTVRGIPLHTRYSSGRREALKRRELGSRTAGKSAPRLSTLSRCSPPQLTLAWANDPLRRLGFGLWEALSRQRGRRLAQRHLTATSSTFRYACCRLWLDIHGWGGVITGVRAAEELSVSARPAS